MRLAAEIAQNGMAGGQAFKDAITETIREHGCRFLIETGTYMGTGTTQAILEGMGPGAQLLTIEVNPQHSEIARKNLDDPRVSILTGLSIPRELLPKRINTEGLPDSVFIDHQEEDRERLYQQEVGHKVADNMLVAAMAVTNNYRPDFVLLDSAGHMGYTEWSYFMAINRSNRFILALDDTNHLKHYQTTQAIEKDDRFKKLWETKEKFGSAIYQFEG